MERTNNIFTYTFHACHELISHQVSLEHLDSLYTLKKVQTKFYTSMKWSLTVRHISLPLLLLSPHATRARNPLSVCHLVSFYQYTRQVCHYYCYLYTRQVCHYYCYLHTQHVHVIHYQYAIWFHFISTTRQGIQLWVSIADWFIGKLCT